MNHCRYQKLSVLFALLLLLSSFCSITGSAEQSAAAEDPGADELIYFIMTDRYANGDPGNDGDDCDPEDPLKRHGGDFRGIIEHLDEIQALGTTMIWLTPVQQNTAGGYHGYWIDDFFSIDPHLGKPSELRELCDKAHERGMKVMLDFVVNHTGVSSALYRERKNDSWFHPDKAIQNMKKKSERENGWLAGLPDLDQDNPEVRDYLIEAALWLIETSGCDAFRLDTVIHVPIRFWSDFHEAVLSRHPDFFMLAEVYNYQTKTLKYYQSESGIEGFLNYPLYNGIRTAFHQHGSTGDLKRIIREDLALSFYKQNGVFFDNHDNVRFFSSQKANADAYYLQGLAFVMTYPGIPVLYYGSEYAAEGGEDPDNRRMMDFERGHPEVSKLWQTLLDLRKKGGFREGEWHLLDSDDQSLLYVIEANQQRWLFAYNIASEEKEVMLEENAEDIKLLVLFGSDSAAEAAFKNGRLFLPAHSVSIWELPSAYEKTGH